MNTMHLETVEQRYALVRKAFDVKKDIELRYLEMGAVLKEIRDSGAWVDTYESFDNPQKHNFLEDLNIKKSTAHKLIQIYEKLVLENKVSPTKLLEAGGWSKLAEILPMVTDKQSADRYVDLAIAARNQKDLRENLREERTGVLIADCPHNDFYVLKICRRCNDRSLVADSDSLSQDNNVAGDSPSDSNDSSDNNEIGRNPESS